MRAQADLTRQFVSGASDSLYVPLYGPQVSMFFAPFARLPYGFALAAWLALNVLIYAFCCYAVWKTCPGLQPYRWTVLILAAAFPGFFHLLAWGQTSGLALLCFTLAYLALQRNHLLLAGLAIGSLIFKPQLGLAAAVVFVCAREWKVVGGAVLAASIQLAAAWMHYGTVVMHSYLHALAHVREVMPLLEPRLYQTQSLRSFWFSASALAAGRAWAVRGECRSDSGAGSSRLEEQFVTVSPLPSSVASNGVGVSSFDCV